MFYCSITSHPNIYLFTIYKYEELKVHVWFSDPQACHEEKDHAKHKRDTKEIQRDKYDGSRDVCQPAWTIAALRWIVCHYNESIWLSKAVQWLDYC